MTNAEKELILRSSGNIDYLWDLAVGLKHRVEELTTENEALRQQIEHLQKCLDLEVDASNIEL